MKNETKGEKAILIEGARRIGESTIPGLLSKFIQLKLSQGRITQLSHY